MTRRILVTSNQFKRSFLHARSITRSTDELFPNSYLPSLRQYSTTSYQSSINSASTESSLPLASQEPSKLSTSYKDQATGKEKRPRWSYTPERMKMPVRIRLTDQNSKWECNSDPKRLDQFYIKLLGQGGDKLLTEEVKWLAITHKSFEQGARGFNDRLAFLGRRILNMQASLILLSSPVPVAEKNPEGSLSSESDDDRTPFEHAALYGLVNLVNRPISEILSRQKLASFASEVGMRDVIRWHPRMRNELDKSGIEVVLATSVYAIVGALALQNGGDVAISITKSNILMPIMNV